MRTFCIGKVLALSCCRGACKVSNSGALLQKRAAKPSSRNPKTPSEMQLSTLGPSTISVFLVWPGQHEMFMLHLLRMLQATIPVQRFSAVQRGIVRVHKSPQGLIDVCESRLQARKAASKSTGIIYVQLWPVGHQSCTAGSQSVAPAPSRVSIFSCQMHCMLPYADC